MFSKRYFQYTDFSLFICRLYNSSECMGSWKQQFWWTRRATRSAENPETTFSLVMWTAGRSSSGKRPLQFVVTFKCKHQMWLHFERSVLSPGHIYIYIYIHIYTYIYLHPPAVLEVLKRRRPPELPFAYGTLPQVTLKLDSRYLKVRARILS